MTTRWVGPILSGLALIACNTSPAPGESAAGAAGGLSGAAGQGNAALGGMGGLSSGGGVSGSGGPSQGGSDSSGGATASSGTGGTGASGAVGGTAASAGDAGLDCNTGVPAPDARCLPPEEPSTRTIYFDIKNTKTSDIYVVTSGSQCTPNPVRAAGASIDLIQGLLGGDCPCGVACDGESRSNTQKLGPGGTVTLTWDGRELKLGWAKVPDPCDPSGNRTISELRSVARCVTSGDYTVTIGYFLAPPCAYCGARPTYDDSFILPCEADHYQSATFALPATGDVRVPIDIADSPAGR